MSYIIFNPAQVDATKQFALGTVATDHLGRDWIYVEADAALDAGDMAIIHGDFGAEGVTATLAAHDAGAGKICGLTVTALASGEFGWLARKGTGSDFLLKLVGVVDDFQPLAPTSTAGELDNFDAGSATAPFITGCVITTASGGAELEVCILDNPCLQTDYPA